MDDMEDSLFEGMVLFDPSSSSQFPAELPLDHTNKHDDSVELSNHREISQQSVQSTTPGASFEPLDENLFSDLTLIQPQSEYDDVSNSLDPPLSPSSSSTSSRSTVTTDFAATTSFASVPQTSITSTRSLTSQISSTRKKKRAGLRIGYGRTSAVQSLDSDSAIDVDNSQVPVPASVSVSSVSSPVVVSQVKLELEEKPQNRVTESEIKAVASETEDLEGGIEINEAVTTSSTLEHKVEEEQEVAEDESKEDSIEVRYEQVKKQVAEKLDHAREMVASVSGKRKEVIRKRRKAAEELNSVSVKYKEMEKELEEAVESEDFETAERVSDGLAAAEKEKEVLSGALREAEAECDAIDLKMQEALEMQIVAEEECAALLQSFAVVSLPSLLSSL
ncbi:putative UVR domain-containing protein [Helianthus annuus]|nr:putative UVR domain-containing protein [Helianthus annuus]